VDAAYSSFLKDYPNCLWLFRALDDTFVHIDNLYLYVRRLTQVFDPFGDLVVRAHANFERGIRAYVHGGAGWLVSRAYIAHHTSTDRRLVELSRTSRYRQDDTAQTVFLDTIYRKPAEWDEMLLNGFSCANCDDWREFPACPLFRISAPVRDIIAVHTFGASTDGMKIVEIMQRKFKDVMFWRDNERQEISICRRKVWGFPSYDPRRRDFAAGNTQ
jgi:hypothetical protein